MYIQLFVLNPLLLHDVRIIIYLRKGDYENIQVTPFAHVRICEERRTVVGSR